MKLIDLFEEMTVHLDPSARRSIADSFEERVRRSYNCRKAVVTAMYMSRTGSQIYAEVEAWPLASGQHYAMEHLPKTYYVALNIQAHQDTDSDTWMIPEKFWANLPLDKFAFMSKLPPVLRVRLNRIEGD
jgi:hypothetical protein